MNDFVIHIIRLFFGTIFLFKTAYDLITMLLGYFCLHFPGFVSMNLANSEIQQVKSNDYSCYVANVSMFYNK